MNGQCGIERLKTGEKKIFFQNFLSVCVTVPFGKKPSYRNFLENKLRFDPGSPHFKTQN